ncbi:hypothetical protein BRCON_2282 [Candidatus Sumerlaea chitinivorans]|uniref:Uncharacterized protein n=1 Tax=Sumerlaea chitinivorans TaxID=2250252 RepID=A0A2Z4Y852_SUMC1|nr:hypothetical protein BRCON_2282 [Candidatus Sumerlaea chitinivorans]
MVEKVCQTSNCNRDRRQGPCRFFVEATPVLYFFQLPRP